MLMPLSSSRTRAQALYRAHLYTSLGFSAEARGNLSPGTGCPGVGVWPCHVPASCRKAWGALPTLGSLGAQ